MIPLEQREVGELIFVLHGRGNLSVSNVDDCSILQPNVTNPSVVADGFGYVSVRYNGKLFAEISFN